MFKYFAVSLLTSSVFAVKIDNNVVQLSQLGPSNEKKFKNSKYHLFIFVRYLFDFRRRKVHVHKLTPSFVS